MKRFSFHNSGKYFADIFTTIIIICLFSTKTDENHNKPSQHCLANKVMFANVDFGNIKLQYYT